MRTGITCCSSTSLCHGSVALLFYGRKHDGIVACGFGFAPAQHALPLAIVLLSICIGHLRLRLGDKNGLIRIHRRRLTGLRRRNAECCLPSIRRGHDGGEGLKRVL